MSWLKDLFIIHAVKGKHDVIEGKQTLRHATTLSPGLPCTCRRARPGELPPPPGGPLVSSRGWGVKPGGVWST